MSEWFCEIRGNCVLGDQKSAVDVTAIRMKTEELCIAKVSVKLEVIKSMSLKPNQNKLNP